MTRPVLRALLRRTGGLAILVALSFTLVACDTEEGRVAPIGPVGAVGESAGIPGSGTIASEVRNVADFQEIWFSSEGAVIVSVGQTASVTVAADDNLLEYLVTETSSGRLGIATLDGVDIAPSAPPVFTIGIPSLAAAELAGAGSLAVDAVTGDRLELTLSGVGDFTIESVAVEALAVDLRGVGTLSLSGTVQTQDIYAGGVTQYLAAGLESKSAVVEAAGDGHATIWVHDDLTLTAGGTSSVEFWGTPQVERRVSDAASFVALGAKEG